MSVLTTFASMGSGWVLEKVLKVDVKFARFQTDSRLVLYCFATKIANSRCLLNIRNHEDQQCFRYCYVAAYHLHHGIGLDKVDQNYQTSPTTYNQPGIHQSLGELDLPMGFEDIPEFEKLNDVQVNVFGYENGQLFPLKISSYESELVMELFLLYDDDHHHYVLITHLVKVVCYVRRIDFCFCYRICRNCSWICRDGLGSYNVHMTNYGHKAPAVIHMLSCDQNPYKFTKLSATWFVS